MAVSVSVIVCSRNTNPQSIHKMNVLKTSGINNIEYILIDNATNLYSLSAAYNEGVRRAKGDFLLFMHDDVFFAEGDWAAKLIRKFDDSSVGLVGVAGTSYLFADNPGWVAAGRPFIHGQVIHELDNGNIFNLTVFSWEKEDQDVVAVDGLLFAIRQSLFNNIAFDETVFDGFHFYDIDICMQVRKYARCIVTRDILVKHQSGGSFDGQWKQYAIRFLQKYHTMLPASCTEDVPDRSNRINFENFDIKGRAPQDTIY